MVHDLKQNVEDVWVGFFISSRRTTQWGSSAPHRSAVRPGRNQHILEGSDQSGNGMLLHVFTHVKTLEVNSHDECQLLRKFRLSHPGRTGEKERADGLFRTLNPARERLIA